MKNSLHKSRRAGFLTAECHTVWQNKFTFPAPMFLPFFLTVTFFNLVFCQKLVPSVKRINGDKVFLRLDTLRELRQSTKSTYLRIAST